MHHTQNPMLSDLARSHLVRTGADCAELRPSAPSYASSWEWYINGHVASKLSRQYIVNLLGSTTARATDGADSDGPQTSSSDDEGGGDPEVPGSVGNMDLVQRTIDGMWANGADDGMLGFGRYSTSIRLGRNLWQSPPLSDDVKRTHC